MPSLRSQISSRFGRCWAEAAVKLNMMARPIAILVRAGLVPAIHDFLSENNSWMPATTSAYTRVFDALCAGMALRNIETNVCNIGLTRARYRRALGRP